MTWFIKTERFTKESMKSSPEKRNEIIKMHKEWVKNINNSGVKICSGYLVDNLGKPGGGGLLLFEAKSWDEAKTIILSDPMIEFGLVKWKLEEWKSVFGFPII
tara:strand:- start:274 stop:582 length:309 start_codon:yes stop_codon:yes gene_type:complete